MLAIINSSNLMKVIILYSGLEEAMHVQGNDTKMGGREESLGDNFLVWAGELGL